MYTTDIVGEKKRKTSNILYNNANSVTKYAGGGLSTEERMREGLFGSDTSGRVEGQTLI